LKTAIIADWLTNYAGAENVISAFYRLYPESKIFTTLFNAEKMKDLAGADVETSYIQKIPGAKNHHPWFLSLMPLAVESFDLSKYNVVLSSSHSIAKGVITKPETMHVCYCHTPMRYAWDDFHKYIRESNFPWLIKKMIPKQISKIRLWDRLSADRVDYFIANSSYVAQRIKKYYQRNAEVIYPPVNTDKFDMVSDPVEDYYLAVGRLIPYKKFDLLVETFNQNGKKLKIAGTGSEMKKLKTIAKNNIEFLGFVSDEKLKKLYANCKAFLFPQIEDAGIAPLEAMASGRPVIALKTGGVMDILEENKTGVFFEKQNIASLSQVIEKFETLVFDPSKIRKHAQQYSTEEFQKKIHRFVKEKYKNRNQ